MTLSQIVDTVLSELFQECGNIITLHPMQRERITQSIAYRLKSMMEVAGEVSPQIKIDTEIYERMAAHIKANILTIDEEGNEDYIEISCRDCCASYIGPVIFKDHADILANFQHNEGCLYSIITAEKGAGIS